MAFYFDFYEQPAEPPSFVVKIDQDWYNTLVIKIPDNVKINKVPPRKTIRDGLRQKNFTLEEKTAFFYEYCEGLTFAAIAKKYGVRHVARISNLAQREHWTERKKRWEAEFVKRLDQKTGRNYAKFVEEELAITDKAQRLIDAGLNLASNDFKKLFDRLREGDQVEIAEYAGKNSSPIAAVSELVAAQNQNARLRSFLLGGPDQRSESSLGISTDVNVWLAAGFTEAEIEAYVVSGVLPEGKEIPR